MSTLRVMYGRGGHTIYFYLRNRSWLCFFSVDEEKGNVPVIVHEKGAMVSCVVVYVCVYYACGVPEVIVVVLVVW